MASVTCREFARKWNPECVVAGHIFHMKLRQVPLALHYAVRINVREVISWGPVYGPAAAGKGHFEITECDRRYTRVRDVDYVDREMVRGNVMASIRCFTEKWDYCIRGWNCEHWARLVAVGEPLSYQVKELYLSVGRITGGHFKNPDAVAALQDERGRSGYPCLSR